jgi:hypothetical protein
MIFSGTSPDGEKHIEKIFEGQKTQTRRISDKYQEGKDYAVQPKRCAGADPRGRIYIMTKGHEDRVVGYPISTDCAFAEGGYTPQQYEALFEKMYPGWTDRWVYVFRVIGNPYPGCERPTGTFCRNAVDSVSVKLCGAPTSDCKFHEYRAGVRA